MIGPVAPYESEFKAYVFVPDPYGQTAASLILRVTETSDYFLVFHIKVQLIRQWEGILFELLAIYLIV